jgi:hypothetical protein
MVKVFGFFALERLRHGVAPYRPILFPQVGSIKTEGGKRLEEAWVFIRTPLDWWSPDRPRLTLVLECHIPNA